MNPLRSVIKLLYDATYSVVLSPLYFFSGFTKRDQNKIVFGCHLGTPAGNILSFYKHCLAADENKKIFWIAGNEETFQVLDREGYPVIRKKSLKGIYTCLTAKFFCYSSYISDISFTLSRNSKPINLWHGTPLKKIEADIQNGIYSIRYKHQWIFRFIQPWIFIKPYRMFTSSDYERACFETAFKITKSEFYPSYPPRLIGLRRRNTQSEYKRILLAPTFRDGGSTNYDALVDLKRINDYCKENNITITIKSHPADTSFDDLDYQELSHIELAHRLTNIYTLLPEVDLVITDYSSIFFDCHYLSIPFLLHWPDLRFYTSNCREFYFDPQQILTEQISQNDDELIKNIAIALKGQPEISTTIFDKYEVASDYPLGIFEEITLAPTPSRKSS
ncbi:CDP-glycerol glycerophosphotransferase family protein [Pseudomonas citronellolis]|uniref:CDP-glycerol glycerophosphotransferase family protein n=1 Tax=Pseudomonas citronellolis TaxID=53408 RepID=UPI0021BF2739|nr:CDP-glycerol glycerophosphotransferase family protein [Pseudomonas citronellolis]MDN6871699.1 CDP-glycerol glycerophosphotransferase family protein [Pseudomonas citronellolis]UXJ54177.1 CDP-glycerol glycerophosphotransferase family protein [Pseudomonas citronellolis]WBG65982.1 CDP-glycerol glycerophosphotransferase [Pseudomonas citronellolis]